METCLTFRSALERALTEPARGAGPGLGLDWHGHLLGCSECRALLEAEEALEQLLSSLPEPSLPSDLTERLLARLRTERIERIERIGPQLADPLERLLDRDAEPEVPADLSRRVLAGLGPARREAQRQRTPDSQASPVAPDPLDALLARVPAPSSPAGLEQRVLRGLESERRAGHPQHLRPLQPPVKPPADAEPRPRRVRFGAAALALAAALLLVLGWLRRGASGVVTQVDPDPTPVALVERGAEADALEVEPELLAVLDVLEYWDWVQSDDLDLLLAEMDPADWALLEHDDLEEELSR